MNNNIAILVFLAIIAITFFFTFKLYQLSKEKGKQYGKNLSPNIFWYIAYCLCLISISLSPISLIMVLYKYKKIKDMDNTISANKSLISSPTNVDNEKAPNSIIKEEDDYSESDTVSPILKTEDLVYYKRNGDTVDCYLKFESE